MVVRIQETPQELPGVRRGRADNPLSPQQAGAAGRQIQEFGQATQRAGGALGEIILKEQEKANKVRLNDAFNQASAAAHNLRYNKDVGYLNLKGGEAVKGVTGEDGVARPITEWYGEKLNKQLADIRKGLGNAAVAEQFDMLAGDLSTKFRGETVAYEAEQSSVYAVQVNDATILDSGNNLAAEPFGKASAFYISRARDAALSKGRAAGLTDDALEQAAQATLGKMHTAVIDSLLGGKNTAGAKAYYEAHSGDFMALDAKNIKAKLDTAWSAAEAIQSVDTVVREFPLRLNAPVNRSAMDAQLREQYKDNPEGLKAARSELSQRISDHEFQENEQNAGNVNAVWKRLNAGESLASVESTSAWLALPGDTQASLKASFQSRNENGSMVTDAGWAAWGQLMGNDDEINRMTPTQLTALEPYFGRQLVNQLLTRKRQLDDEKQKAVATPGKIDNDMFNAFALSYGLKPFSKNDNDKVAVAKLRSDLETGIAQYQAATGKVVPPSEMEDLLRQRGARFMTMNNIVRPMYEAGLLQTPENMLPQVLEYMQARGWDPTPENKRRATLELYEAATFLVDE